MQPPLLHIIRDQKCWLSPERCIYWENQGALILSDMHFGKSGHFRKSGIAVPANVYKQDLQRLVAQLQHFQPAQLIIVGDLFHSAENRELELFIKWRRDFPALDIQLVKGNHDILKRSWYEAIGIEVSDKELTIGEFEFCHDCQDLDEENPRYAFSGHIHPGIRLSGLGKQALHFPCFYFASNYCVLPAFGRFTGLALVDPAEDEAIFAIVEDKVMRLQ